MISTLSDDKLEENLIHSTYNNELEKGKGISNYIKKNTLLNNGIVFDFGTGTGGVLEIFKKSGFETFGVDLNDGFLKFGINRGLNLRRGSIYELKNYPRKANLIIASHVLEHLHNLDYYLREFWDCLEDNGFLYIALPGLFVVQKLFRSLQPFFVIEHLYYFTLLTLRKILMENGFRLVAGNEEISAIFQKTSRKYNIKISQDYIDDILFYLRIVDLPLPFNACKIIRNKRKLKNMILIYFISFIYKTRIINVLAIIRILIGKKFKAGDLKKKFAQYFSFNKKIL